MTDTVLIDPTNELDPAQRSGASALATLHDGSLALLDIAKPRGSVFLDRIELHLAKRGIGVERFRKPTHAKVAPPDLRRQISQRCRATIVALAD